MYTRRTVLANLAGAGVAGLAGCGAREGGGGPGVTPVPGESSLALTSPAFGDGDPIPRAFTFDGDDVSPPLSVSGVPGDAGSLALLVLDRDAPGGTFAHWLLWNLPPDVGTIPRGIPQIRWVESLGGAHQGTNGFGELGYRGPRPPEDDGPHTYAFTLYAMPEPVNVQAGASHGVLSRAMAGRPVASATLTGTYDR
ncbi:MAG: YbhB/YbcL family Raf kinase inhibitor-like protein [Halorientalis sp.]